MFSDSNMFRKIYKTLAVMSNAFHFINLQYEAELGVPEELVSYTVFLDTGIFHCSATEAILAWSEILPLNSSLVPTFNKQRPGFICACSCTRAQRVNEINCHLSRQAENYTGKAENQAVSEQETASLSQN